VNQRLWRTEQVYLRRPTLHGDFTPPSQHQTEASWFCVLLYGTAGECKRRFGWSLVPNLAVPRISPGPVKLASRPQRRIIPWRGVRICPGKDVPTSKVGDWERFSLHRGAGESWRPGFLPSSVAARFFVAGYQTRRDGRFFTFTQHAGRGDVRLTLTGALIRSITRCISFRESCLAHHPQTLPRRQFRGERFSTIDLCCLMTRENLCCVARRFSLIAGFENLKASLNSI
jgi:hypothetical protein